MQTSLSRRAFLAASAATLATQAHADDLPFGKADACIMLWLGGGASQGDTFDPKKLGDPKAKKAGSAYKSIPSAVQGVEVCEHLPRTAERMDRLTILRSVHHDVIDEHAIAVNRMHTGRRVTESVQYPSIGSIVAHERGAGGVNVPPYVVIGYPSPTRGPGFLGPKAGYLYLTETENGPAGLTRPSDLSAARALRREKLLEGQPTPTDATIRDYAQAARDGAKLGGPEFMNVFNLKNESADLRKAYGSEFGQRCLLARRLVETGVRFVEVAFNLNFVNGTGWDTHNDGQLKQHVLIQDLDQAFSTLLDDLEKRKRLDKTLIVISTEFGRPPEFDGGGGRGHQSKAFSVVLAGGGLKHRGAYGVTDELGKKIVESPVSVPDFFATTFQALGIAPDKELYAGERPVPITDGGKPVKALFV